MSRPRFSAPITFSQLKPWISAFFELMFNVILSRKMGAGDKILWDKSNGPLAMLETYNFTCQDKEIYYIITYEPMYT